MCFCKQSWRLQNQIWKRAGPLSSPQQISHQWRKNLLKAPCVCKKNLSSIIKLLWDNSYLVLRYLKTFFTFTNNSHIFIRIYKGLESHFKSHLMTTVVASMANTGAVNWNVTKSDKGSIFTATNWSRIVTDMAKLQMMAANQLVLSGISSSETSRWNILFTQHWYMFQDWKDTPHCLFSR